MGHRHTAFRTLGSADDEVAQKPVIPPQGQIVDREDQSSGEQKEELTKMHFPNHGHQQKVARLFQRVALWIEGTPACTSPVSYLLRERTWHFPAVQCEHMCERKAK